MFRVIRSFINAIRAWFFKKIGVTSVVNDLNYEIGQRLDIQTQLRNLQAQIDLVSSSFLPVILVKAKAYLDPEKKDVFYESSWYVQAEAHARTINLWTSPMYGYCIIESVTLLNGPYALVRVAISNLEAIIGDMHPAGKPLAIPPNIANVTPANRISFTLERF